ncbi:hypothetical protein ABT337_22725 [Saccharopolyspora hirsuta]|uniref:hypothetical protein n=1 Tax=Saccharopolyspora hirsuta TaxID=1837 RepID=UPI00332DBFFE
MPRRLGERQVFEVFTRTTTDQAITNVGSVTAPDAALAWQLAKETCGRRDDLADLWVVSRADIVAADKTDQPRLTARTRMPHRQPAFPMRRREMPRDQAAPPSAPRETRAAWSSLAEDLFLCSHLLAGRLYDFVELETSLAEGSIAQECLAHASVLAELSGAAPTGVDEYFFERSPDRWLPSGIWFRGSRSWSAAVVRGLLLALALELAMNRSHVDGQELRQLAVEQEAHSAHWGRAFAALLADEEIRDELRSDFQQILDVAGDLLGVPPLDTDPDVQAEFADRLVRAGVPDSWLAAWPSSPRPRQRSWSAGIEEVITEVNAVRRTYDPGVIL